MCDDAVDEKYFNKIIFINDRRMYQVITSNNLFKHFSLTMFGEPVPHGLSARPRVWAGPTKG